MANTKTSGPRKEYAEVDTAPGASGYSTNVVSPNAKSISKLFFSVRETGDSDTFTATVTLQWRCGNEEWQDYEIYTTADRVLIEDNGGGVQWRAIVDNGDYTSGVVSFGFDW